MIATLLALFTTFTTASVLPSGAPTPPHGFRFVPGTETTTISCTYGGIIAEDHFDASMAMSFGICEAADGHVHYLAAPHQCAGFAFGNALTLEVRAIERLGYASAASASAHSSQPGSTAQYGATWTAAGRVGYGIIRVLLNEAP